MDEARQPKSPKLKGELTDLKRHRISELAKAFFFDRGYSATSFDILAAELGVTKPLIYGVYRSKAELLKELCLRPVIEARDVVEFARTMTGPPTQKIRRLLFDLSMLMCHRRMETTISLPSRSRSDIEKRSKWPVCVMRLIMRWLQSLPKG